MAVSAIAMMGGWDIFTAQYQLGYQYTVKDGSNPVHTGAGNLNVNFGTTSSKINQLWREAIAADILSNFSLTIDPNDILIPLT